MSNREMQDVEKSRRTVPCLKKQVPENHPHTSPFKNPKEMNSCGGP
jgi:hypothetical protein